MSEETNHSDGDKPAVPSNQLLGTKEKRENHMSDITEDMLNPEIGSEPLIAYPWKDHADSLIRWARDKDSSQKCLALPKGSETTVRCNRQTNQ